MFRQRSTRTSHRSSPFFESNPRRTYGIEPIQDVIDKQGAMEAFFSARLEWLPTFRNLAGSKLPVDTNSLLCEIESSNVGVSPNKSIADDAQRSTNLGIPDDPEDRMILEAFLNSMHQSLVDIPVTNSLPDGPLENENDLTFLEEGRRLLAIDRFHVLRDNHGGSLEAVDNLFTYCWNEIQELARKEDGHTGSIIFLPQYSSLSDLHRFTDMNLVRPMEWLGQSADYEIVSLAYGSPAIRMLYKLREMPEGEIEVQRLSNGE